MFQARQKEKIILICRLTCRTNLWHNGFIEQQHGYKNMSCYILNDETINMILNFAFHKPTSVRLDGEWHHIDRFSPQGMTMLNRLGNILKGQNYKSWNDRYRENEVPSLFRFEVSGYGNYSIVDAIKCLDCYEYQSCDSHDWVTSTAYDLCLQLRRIYTQRLPGYDTAAWGL